MSALIPEPTNRPSPEAVRARGEVSEQVNRETKETGKEKEGVVQAAALGDDVQAVRCGSTPQPGAYVEEFYERGVVGAGVAPTR